MATIKLTIEYDGTCYAGWQRQLDQPTIQSAIEEALQAITQAKVSIIGAGRTDAGAHALGQVVSFRWQNAMSDEEWKRALNGLLPLDISVVSAEFVSDHFHARYSARGKVYEYRILHRRERPSLDRQRVWHVRQALQVHAMREAAGLLVGQHDFSSFQGSRTDTENPICKVSQIEVLDQGHLLQIQVRADRFLKQMVRAMVGTLVEVGLGKRTPESVKEILQARDRRAAGHTAPAHGLYLVRVDY